MTKPCTGWALSNSWSSSMMCTSPRMSTARCSQPSSEGWDVAHSCHSVPHRPHGPHGPSGIFTHVSLGSFRMKLTSSQKQNSVKVSVQRRLLVHGYPHVVDAPFEHEGARPDWVHLSGHQWVPPGKREDVVGKVSRGVDALGSVHVCNTLQRNTKGHRWLEKSDVQVVHEERVWRAYRSRPRLWHPPCVLPPLWVLDLHVRPIENLLYIWEGILADSGCFDILPGKQSEAIQRSTWGLMIHQVIVCHPDWISNTPQIINFQSQDNIAPLWLRVWALRCLGPLRSYQRFLNGCVGGPSLTGMWFPLFIFSSYSWALLQEELFVPEFYQQHTHPPGESA